MGSLVCQGQSASVKRKRFDLVNHKIFGVAVSKQIGACSKARRKKIGWRRKQCSIMLTHSIRSIEPSKEEIVKSAKLYYVLEELKKQTGSASVTVDCLSLFYENHMKAYPCL